jgi:protein TonB
MPRDLFGDVTRPSISVGSRKWYTLPVSLFSHSAIVLAIVAVPILAPGVMPSVFADDDMTLITTIIPPAPPPPRRLEAVKPPVANPDLSPVVAPDGLTPEVPRVETPESSLPEGFVPGGIDSDGAVLAPPPRPEVQAPPKPVQVGGLVRTPVKTRDVNPVYPVAALAARIQGIVIIEATIGEDGQVINARILRSVPLLDRAAIDAVRQWQYTPTLLNGRPVPVIMTVTVQFTLQ